MPQFDFANVFLPQFVWLCIFFAILYFGIVMPTLPKLGRVMGAREEKVGGDIATAEQAKAEADALQRGHDTDMADAREASRLAIADAKAQAARAAEERLAAAAAAGEAQISAAEARIATARSNALAEIETVAAESAAAIVERLTGSAPDPAAAGAAVRAAMTA